MYDKEFWLSIQNNVHIENREYCRSFSTLSMPKNERVRKRLMVEGYAPFRQNNWDDLILRCNQILSRLYEVQAPVVFAFLYDELWELFAKIRPALLQAFDGEYYLLPLFWAWYVDPAKGKSHAPYWNWKVPGASFDVLASKIKIS